MKTLSKLTVCLVLSLGSAALSWAADKPASTAAEKSADEVAKELANPNNSLASLTFKNQYRWYTGDLAGADNQDNYTLLFQPVFPFYLEPSSSGGKANLFIRPAIPLLINQPVPELGGGGDIEYNDVTALGDIGFDIGYGVTEKSGFLWALGMVGTLPTATDDDIGGDQLRLGPELLVAQFYDWGLWGLFPSHQWDVRSNGEESFSTSQLQLFLKFLPGGGWNVGTAPIINYDWEGEEWTLPLNVVASKTLKIGSTPVKVEVELNYYVEQPDAFGPEWMLGFNITPVVHNFIEEWVRGK